LIVATTRARRLALISPVGLQYVLLLLVKGNNSVPLTEFNILVNSSAVILGPNCVFLNPNSSKYDLLTLSNNLLITYLSSSIKCFVIPFFNDTSLNNLSKLLINFFVVSFNAYFLYNTGSNLSFSIS
jgi:hypothetical protein